MATLWEVMRISGCLFQLIQQNLKQMFTIFRRSSLFLLGVTDIDAALAALQMQAQQALAACGADKAA